MRVGCWWWRGEASCISQICRVIKLIKRLTHGGLALFSLGTALSTPNPTPLTNSLSPLLFCISSPLYIYLYLSRYHSFARVSTRPGPWYEWLLVLLNEGTGVKQDCQQPASSFAHQIIVITEYYAAVSAAQTRWPINCGYVP